VGRSLAERIRVRRRHHGHHRGHEQGEAPAPGNQSPGGS
jgi:hypothetical protein